MAPAPLLSPPPCYSQANASLIPDGSAPATSLEGAEGVEGREGRGDGTGGCLSTTLQSPLARKGKGKTAEQWKKLGTLVLTGPCEWSEKIQSGDGKGKMRPSRWFINTDTHTNEVTGIFMWGAAWSKPCVCFYWFCMYNTLVVESWLNSELD